MVKLGFDASVTSDNPYPAVMLNRQFAALHTHLQRDRLEVELGKLSALKRRTKIPTLREGEVARLLQNGWNTERMLNMTAMLLADGEGGYALQWAFPQAYYACYSVALAYFRVAGHSETKHASVIRKVGNLMSMGKYPSSISCLATGGMREMEYRNIRRSPSSASIHFDALDPTSVETQICQFLKATRELDLDGRKAQLKLRTRTGKLKKSFSKSDWAAVSERLGYTSLMSLLYRKRVKSNYYDIETLLAGGVDAVAIHSALVHIVSCFNFVHEAFIGRLLGIDAYGRVAVKARGSSFKEVLARQDRIAELFPEVA